jgi:hypothetical protein
MSGERRRLQPIPYYYKEDELIRYQKAQQKKGIAYDIQPYLDAPLVNLELSQKFKTEAEGLRDTVLRDEFNRLGFPANFSNHITIYTKYDFDQVLQRAIAWFKTQKQQPYILITEALFYKNIQRIFDNDTKELIDYKSSEWVFKLFLHHPTAALLKPPVRLLDEASIDAHKTPDYFNTLEADTFVLMDDGIYSGKQKSKSIQYFIKKRTKPFTFYLIPMYWTEEGVLFIVQSIQMYYTKQHALSVSIDRKKNLYTITIRSKHPSVFYIWLGGDSMNTVTRLNIKKIIYSNDDGHLELGEGSSKNLGMTLCLFEHKIPDNLSLNKAIGDFYAHRLATHYRYNPPYKKITKKASPVVYE